MLKFPLLFHTASFVAGQHRRHDAEERGEHHSHHHHLQWHRGRSRTRTNSSPVRNTPRKPRDIEEGGDCGDEKTLRQDSPKAEEGEGESFTKAEARDDDAEPDDVEDEQGDSGTASPTGGEGGELEPELPLNLFGRVRQNVARFWHFVLQTGPSAIDDSLDHLPNYRWLPIFSGIVIPFSILLEIPGLTEHWYIVTENNKTVLSRPNGGLLDTGLGVSMACALIANLAIINRFLERRIRTMTLIAIVALSIHDIINIVAVTYFGVIHRFNDGFTYGQSFWFTLCSTIASVFTNISLIVDYVRTPDFAYASSGLTRKQRSLVIVVMILLCWIAFGALINGILMSLSFIDGLYFTVVTIETIGFGDIFPKSAGAKVFAGLHGTIGVLFVALAVSTCNETVIESFEHSYRRHLEGLRERRRERKVKRSKSRASNRAIRRQLEMAGLPVYVHEHVHHHNQASGGARRKGVKRLNVEALSEEQRQDAEREAEEISRLESEPLSRKSTFSSIQTFDAAFADSMQKEFAVKLTVVWSLFLLFWLVGAAIFMATEKWTFGRGMWFCFESFSTIGYGDQTPQTPSGRAVFIVWALLGVGTMTILISVLSEAYSSRYQKVLNAKVKKPTPVKDLKSIIRKDGPAMRTNPMMDIITHEPASSPGFISRRQFRRQFMKRRRHSSLPNMTVPADAGNSAFKPDENSKECVIVGVHSEKSEESESAKRSAADPLQQPLQLEQRSNSSTVAFAPAPSIRPSIREVTHVSSPLVLNDPRIVHLSNS